MPEIQQIHENDTLLVHNIDLNCDHISTEVVKRTKNYTDPNGYVRTSYEEEEVTCDHSQYFEVGFGGKPFRVPPGHVRKMPRFVAKHFAKHLMEHLLQKMEKKTRIKGLTQNKAKQKEILEQILVGVDSYYNQPIDMDEATRAYEEYQTLNADNEKAATNLGKIENVVDEVVVPPAPQDLTDLPAPKLAELEAIPTDPADTDGDDPALTDESPFNKLSKEQLIAECEAMDLVVDKKMTKDDLIALLQKNYG